jgi:two-component system invasion response regulator UvrY
MVREGLAALCQAQPHYRVVAHWAEGATALRLIKSDKSDIAVLDLNLPDVSTLEIVHKLREAQVQTRIVVLSEGQERRIVVETLRAGVNAFLVKSDPASHLLKAFDQILDGGIYVSSSFELDKIIISGKKSILENPLNSLSAREYQVFSLFVEGVRANSVAGLVRLTVQRDHPILFRSTSSKRSAPSLRHRVQMPE